MTETPVPVTVFAYAGASSPERPRAVLWQGRRLEVVRVERSWRTPTGLHFRVLLDELGPAELVYDPHADRWTLVVL